MRGRPRSTEEHKNCHGLSNLARGGVMVLAKRDTGDAAPVRVLFVNTRSAIGADVAVHLSLIENFDPERCEVTVATNNQARDFPRCLAALRAIDGVRVVPLNLGHELARRT